MPRRDSETSCTSHGSDGHEDDSLANDLVMNKYQMAAEMVNSILKEVVAAVKEGVEVSALCDLGDKLLMEKTSKVFKKEKDVAKGIAMPTCVSVDNCICHFSPLRSDPSFVLKDGQFVKIDLGAHIDGYIATAAHTVVVGASKDNKVTGKKADLLKATYEAMEIAIRMLRPGTKNFDITTAIDKVAAEYGVTPIENMTSHQLERNQIEGEKQIIQNPGEKQKVDMEKVTIDKHEAYAIEILFSTGKGKPKDMDARTTVFKKNDEVQYQLKMKASRVFITECNNKHGSMPFTLRSFEDEVKAKMGVVECEKHGLVRPYQVVYENVGDVVAVFKSTVLVMPNGLLKIAGLPLDYSILETTNKLEDATLIATLNSQLKNKRKKVVKKDGNAAADVAESK
uniref:Peptidase_M24 domain-containing protein n=1 Tax=Heterorhabditis bacteriophora TaxID=37862 RepID=A0A1I7XUD2_HETBA